MWWVGLCLWILFCWCFWCGWVLGFGVGGFCGNWWVGCLGWLVWLWVGFGVLAWCVFEVGGYDGGLGWVDIVCCVLGSVLG